MKVVSSWVKDYLRRTMLEDHEMVEALERAGIEVEQVISSKPIDNKVVVALVKKVMQHPNADKLHLVEVVVGESTLRIVCGAPNVREGMKVALAQIGAVLPGGDRIKLSKLRGEASEGMLCSPLELGIGDDHNGILEVSSDVALGTPLCDLYPADTFIDVKTPPNRFDVLSMVGLAREIAAMTGNELATPVPPLLAASPNGPAVTPKPLATRYSLARIKVDQAAPSPGEMAYRLRAVGMRSIGPVVDVTNFVMFELGQPLHAFDAAKVKLPISVRLAKVGESLETLDGIQRSLSPEDLIIADTDGPIALAGVMGGSRTEVSPGTTEILLEAAVFDAAVVRKMAKRHGLRTEGSARFERSIPVDLAPIAIARATQLLEEVAKAAFVTMTDIITSPSQAQHIELRVAKLSALMGFVVNHKDIIASLAKLQIPAQASPDDPDVITVLVVPWWRPDLTLPEDIAEEVVRVMGYARVPSTIPAWRPVRLEFDHTRAKLRRVRDVMYGAGLFDIITYSFVSEDQLKSLNHVLADHLKLKNPLSVEQAYLRSDLLASHLAVLSRNRIYAKNLGFYEISKVFEKRGAGEQPNEPQHLAVTIYRPDQAYAVAKGVLDAVAWELNLPGLVVAPGAETVFAAGRAGVISLDGKTVGRIGQLDPGRLRALKLDQEAAYFELELTPLLEAASVRQFVPLSRFPIISRDVSVVLPVTVTWAQVHDALAPLPVQFVTDYYGEGLPQGCKSLTLRLTVSGSTTTPTEAEAAELERTVLGKLERFKH